MAACSARRQVLYRGAIPRDSFRGLRPPNGSMATLLHYPLCPFSRSIRLALAECGVEVTLTEERPWEWRQGFLELNPAGSLPVLITDEHGPISGAYAISEYLDETAKGDGEARGFRLFPGETLSRAEARRLVDWFHRKFHDEVTAYLVEEKVYRRHGPNSGSPNIAAIRAGHENLRYHLAYMSHLAETRPLALRRSAKLRRPRRGSASLDARLSRRGLLGRLRAGEELVCSAQVETLVPALACRPGPWLHPLGDVCRSRFLTYVGDGHGAFH